MGSFTRKILFSHDGQNSWSILAGPSFDATQLTPIELDFEYCDADAPLSSPLRTGLTVRPSH